MNKYLEQFILVLVALVLVIIDIGLDGVIIYKNLIVFSVLFLQILANLNLKSSLIGIFFVVGITIDWHNKLFLGITPLIFVISLYLFNAFRIRFYGNKVFTSLANLLFGFILVYSFNGFRAESLFYSLFAVLISTGLISYLWLRR